MHDEPDPRITLLARSLTALRGEASPLLVKRVVHQPLLPSGVAAIVEAEAAELGLGPHDVLAARYQLQKLATKHLREALLAPTCTTVFDYRQEFESDDGRILTTRVVADGQLTSQTKLTSGTEVRQESRTSVRIADGVVMAASKDDGHTAYRFELDGSTSSAPLQLRHSANGAAPWVPERPPHDLPCPFAPGTTTTYTYTTDTPVAVSGEVTFTGLDPRPYEGSRARMEWSVKPTPGVPPGDGTLVALLSTLRGDDALIVVMPLGGRPYLLAPPSLSSTVQRVVAERSVAPREAVALAHRVESNGMLGLERTLHGITCGLWPNLDVDFDDGQTRQSGGSIMVSHTEQSGGAGQAYVQHYEVDTVSGVVERYEWSSDGTVTTSLRRR